MARRRIWLEKRQVESPLVSVRDAWIETAIGDGWLAAFRVFERDGELIVGELRVFPEEPDDGDPKTYAYYGTGVRPGGEWSARTLGDRAMRQIPGHGLTVRKLRDVRLEAVRESARELLARLGLSEGANVEELFAPGGPLAERRISPDMFEGTQRGRRPHDDAFLARAAEVYVDHLRRGSPSPTEDTARVLGYSINHTGRLLTKARQHGLLTKTKERRPGGTLTDKAREILAREEET